MRRAALHLLALLALPVAAPAAVSRGEHLAYVVGCINCHHQTPKEIINAPPLLIAKTYTLAQFKSFLKTGVTRTGRDLPKLGSIMGIVAVEQFSHMSDDEVEAIYAFLTREWTAARAKGEEAKIPLLYAGEKKRAKD
jgi:cytochrome c553